jgi:PIN domain nuclease of toxin-antitoxin system
VKNILDASALLAYLQDESGSEVVDKVLTHAIMNSVNWAEVVQKAVAKQINISGMRSELEVLGLVIVPFTVEEAELAARLWKATRQHGLSLGDRACLSSALCLNLPVYTADRIWLELDLPIEIHCVR